MDFNLYVIVVISIVAIINLNQINHVFKRMVLSYEGSKWSYSLYIVLYISRLIFFSKMWTSSKFTKLELIGPKNVKIQSTIFVYSYINSMDTTVNRDQFLEEFKTLVNSKRQGNCFYFSQEKYS